MLSLQTTRFIFCGLIALAVGAITLAGIGDSGLSKIVEPTGPIYSHLVIYPAAILMGCFGFLIMLSATDPGAEK